MPGYDKKGPLGKGPVTGRGFGDCEDFPKRRFGGRPFQRGFATRPMTYASRKNQTKDLSSYKKALVDELKSVEEAEKQARSENV